MPSRPVSGHCEVVNDVEVLTAHNEHFIEACRQGSWEYLRQILGTDFRYLDGRTGEVWEQSRYIDDLRQNPVPTLQIDEVAVHVAGDTATVSARTYNAHRPGRSNRYLDTYERRGDAWLCVHACVWPLPAGDSGSVAQ